MIYFIPVFLLIALAIRLIVMVDSHSLAGAAFFFPFCAFPVIISLILLYFTNLRVSKKRKIIARTLLLITCVLYAIWYCYVDINVQIHPDPQGALAFLFVGIYSVPFLLPFWITALVLSLPGKCKSPNP